MQDGKAQQGAQGPPLESPTPQPVQTPDSEQGSYRQWSLKNYHGDKEASFSHEEAPGAINSFPPRTHTCVFPLYTRCQAPRV